MLMISSTIYLNTLFFCYFLRLKKKNPTKYINDQKCSPPTTAIKISSTFNVLIFKINIIPDHMPVFFYIKPFFFFFLNEKTHFYFQILN